MSYITILDFEKGEIHSFHFLEHWDQFDFSEIADSIENEYGIKFSENNCQWIVQGKLNFKIH